MGDPIGKLHTHRDYILLQAMVLYEPNTILLDLVQSLQAVALRFQFEGNGLGLGFRMV